MTELLEWLDDGCAFSPRFNERYSSCAGALAQAMNVFLVGCDLPQRWRGRESFTVLETGFGLGLNFLNTWAQWEADPQRCTRLHFVSVEGFPVNATDMQRNLALVCSAGVAQAPMHARIQMLGQELTTAWRRLSAGVNHFQFAEGKVQLTVIVDQIRPALEQVACVADAVFLDGFSPSTNPEMWSRETLTAMTAHVRSGTVLATYTVAREVRDSLSLLGFSVAKLKGLPPKRDRLRAAFEGASDPSP